MTEAEDPKTPIRADHKHSKWWRFRVALRRWWYGGQDNAQLLRWKLGVFRDGERFLPPEHPEYHWTVGSTRWIARKITRYAGVIAIGMLIAVLSGLVLDWLRNGDGL
ncbi:MAG: hypothetical protein JJU06_13040 [Ectothiorhodospiraceae bacterium]|uniref:hypothetical protein n=1 Tax=Thioalkalivibrio sp. HL-Eb18 TaxID=1266913 RepID=UPI000378E2D3|nr:hypothetical protein [Thioalkalivibrio sp. HL-Eb18]MCC5811288.1 hypothetical protein [Ectothiorhodospiraceae bacterium]